jgi:hypothetical protein
VDNPWDKRLHRVTYGGPLPHVQPGAIADPSRCSDDGTRCRFRNGGAWGGRDDGYVAWAAAEPPTQTLRSVVAAGPRYLCRRSTPA